MDAVFRDAYDKSLMRCNFISWYEFNPKGQMLVIGDVGKVVLDFLKAEVSEVHLDIVGGTLYDYILLYDSCMDAKFDVLDPIVLKALCRKLKPDGTFFMAMDNYMGLKYLAGATDALTGKAYAKLEGYDGEKKVRSYTRTDAVNALSAAGFKDLYFYYPTPDHIFAEAVYSQDFLPQKGDLRGDSPSYSYGGFSTFSEGMVFDRLIEKGEFENFANSYLVVAR